MPKLPVVAVIANYNMAKQLEKLLPQVVKQGYDQIFVLDDASTDNSQQVVKRFKDVKLVAGKTNKGAGANRNRIIKALDYTALIHFLDADVLLETEKTAELVRQVAPNEPFGFISGLITDLRGNQWAWNYGPRIGLRADLGAQVQLLVGSMLPKHPQGAKRIRQRFARLLSGWPNLFEKPVRREIYWAAEANLVVRSDIFAEFGGFDESLRETEILDLAIRMQQKNLKRYFDPRLVVQHTAGKVREYNRTTKKIGEYARTNRAYGLTNWLLSRDKP